MPNPEFPHPDHDSHDSADFDGGTYELTTPSQDGLAKPESDADPSNESSQTFISDEFDPPEGQTIESDDFDDVASADSRTIQSDEFADPAGQDSQTFISDEFEDPALADGQTIQSDEFDDDAAAESRTIMSDEFDEPDGLDSQTFVSDEFDDAAAESRTVMSDEFDEPDGAESKTFMSDEFEEAGPNDRTIGGPELLDRTVMSDAFEPPPWGDAGGATMMADIDGTSEDERTLQSDLFDDDEPGLMDQSNIRQTINPKSMDSKDRKHWREVIRGAVGSQDLSSQSRKSLSSLVGVKSNLNIQTRTLIEGQPAPGVPIDYRIDTKLGEGGMGAVYLANQTSLNRNVALKVIKPISAKESKRLQQSRRLETVQQHRQGQFLSEAVVTGDLEHPNIVPIYDVAATQDGTVFYSMKCVSGTPWSKVIRKQSVDDNIGILLKVCDAMAFAHSRGVVHRDLKPENVMLGEFGVVLVMDWGLALVTEGFSKHASVKRASSLGGSPAYMAPELATGPLDRIGPAADIYLIGAMLYEIITGRPPHSGSNVSQCLRNAATNKIDSPPEHDGELMDIALRAMASKPEERYPSVQGFQEAVRGYLAHAESIGLARKAKADLQSAQDTEQYSDYARAMFGFEQALDLWDGNEPARQGLSQAQLAYAEHALAKTDYELGLSLLDDRDPAHTPVVSRLRQAQKEQESRKARLTWMKRVAAALLAVIFVGGSGALAVINKQKQEAVALKDDAVTAQQAAERAAEQERVAKEAEAKLKVEAIALKDAAEKSAESERIARVQAVEAQTKAEEAAEKERLAKVAEEKAKNDAIALRVKAEESAEAEKLAKEAALVAQKKAEMATEAEKKATLAALAAKEAEETAKIEAVAQKDKAEKAAEEEKKAKLAAVAAKEAETKAKNEAVELRVKAEMLAKAEMKAKEEALLAKDAETKAKNEAVALRIKAEQAADAEKKAKLAALAAKEAETKAKDAAVAAQLAEEKAKEQALAAKEAETKAKEVAIAAEKQAQYEAYVSKIGLAKARIDQNEFESARELLQQLKADQKTAGLCGWEWGRLMHQASQSASDVTATEPARDVSFSEDGKQSVAALEGGQVEVLAVGSDGTITMDSDRILRAGVPVTSAAVSASQNLIATGDEDGTIRLWSLDEGRELRTLEGHTQGVTKVRFLDGDRLISASMDKTLRIWDLRSSKNLAVAWHIAPVQDVAFSDGTQPYVAAAVADARSGRGVIWQVVTRGDRTEFVPIGDFLGHGSPVFSVAVSTDGQYVASGDGDGRIFLWSRSNATPLDYGAAIDAALDRLSGQAAGRQADKRPTEFTSLTDGSNPLGTLTLIGETDAGAHRDAVRSLDFSSDASRLLSAADDFTIKVWDRSRGRLLETLRGHGGWVRSAQFSPHDEDVVLSAGYDRAVKSWRLSQYSEVLMVDTETAAATGGSSDVQAHGDEIWSARFSRDGRRIVTSSRDRSARLWTLVTDGAQSRIEGPVVLTDEASSVGPKTLVEGHRYLALSFRAPADGRSLLIGGVDGTLRLFDVRRGTERGVLRGCGLNTNFAVSDDGKLILTAASEPGVSALLWECGDDDSVPEQPRVKLRGHDHPVTAFAISADGRRLYTGDQRGNGRLWDATTGETIGAPLTYHEGLRINDAAFLPDGRLVTGSDDLSIVVYNPATGETEQKIQQPGFVTMTSLASDGRHVLTISERSDEQARGTVTSLVTSNLATGQTRVIMESSQDGPKTQIRSARFAADGRRLVSVHGGYDAPESFLRLWEASSDGGTRLVRTLRLPKRLPPCDGALLLSNQSHELVTLHGAAAYQWSLSDLEHHQSYRSHGAVTDAGFSSDARYVATCSESVKIWDAVSGKPVFKLEAPHDGAVYSVEFTPRAGSYEFITAGDDGVAKVWQWQPQEANCIEVRTLATEEAGEAGLRDAVYSPSGEQVLLVGQRSVAELWNVADGVRLSRLSEDTRATTEFLSAAFSSDGQLVVVGGVDKRARLWAVDAEHLAMPENDPQVLEGHADQVASVAFLPTDDASIQRVLTASRDRSARVWDASTGREVMSLRKHSLGLTAVDAVRQGEDGGVLLLTAGLDGRLILWPAGR